MRGALRRGGEWTAWLVPCKVLFGFFAVGFFATEGTYVCCERDIDRPVSSLHGPDSLIVFQRHLCCSLVFFFLFFFSHQTGRQSSTKKKKEKLSPQSDGFLISI